MSGAACEIIINCGALKAKAGELYEAEPRLRPIARELLELEGEICDLAEAIAEYLTPDERAQVHARAAQAWQFGGVIQAFVDARRHNNVCWVQQVTDFADTLRDFIDDQALFFHNLVDVHASDE